MRILLIVALLVPMAARAEPSAHFAPQAFLAGSCWRGTFPDGKRTDEHCYEWVYAGQFLRDRHTHPDATAEVAPASRRQAPEERAAPHAHRY